MAIVGCAALAFVAVVNNVLRGRIDGLVSCWAALFPLTYFVSFPREHPIVTPQRLVVLGAFMGLSFVKPSSLMAHVPEEGALSAPARIFSPLFIR